MQIAPGKPAALKNPVVEPTTFLSVSGTKTGPAVKITLTQQNGKDMYVRTYDCTISDDDQITIPNDLNSRTQTMLHGVILLMKYPNTYEGDS